MNVTYIIPIKKYLAKYLSPKDGKIYYEGVKALLYAFDYYAGYKITKKELRISYEEKKLFKPIKPNQYPKVFIKKYPLDKYTYLKFKFIVTSKRLGKILNNKKFNEDLTYWIKNVNNSLEFMFWLDCTPSILEFRETTINQAINDFYSFYGLINSDYKKSSFKTMLYKNNRSI